MSKVLIFGEIMLHLVPPVYCVCMGSKLMAKQTEGSFVYAKIKHQTKNALQIISALRK